MAGKNGRVYGIPHKGTHVVEFDPSTNKTRQFGKHLGDEEGKWEGGVLGMDGCIYCSPYSDDQILKIDPAKKIRRSGRRSYSRPPLEI